MAEFDNGRPPVTSAEGSIQSVTIDNTDFDEKEKPSIQSVAIDNSDAESKEIFQISSVSINSQRCSRIYGGYL